MAIHFTCPQCQKSLRVADDRAGTRGECPSCLLAFTFPSGDVAAEPQKPEPAAWSAAGNLDPAEAGAAGLDPAWRLVRRGLGAVYLAAAFWAVGVIVVVGVVLWMSRRAENVDQVVQSTFFAAVGVGLLISIFGAIVLGFVGVVMCCAVPSQSRARGFVVVSALCSLAGLALSIAGSGHWQQADQNVENVPLNVASFLLSIVGMFSFLLFIRRVAMFFGNKHLAWSVGRWILTFFGTLVVFVILLVLAHQPAMAVVPFLVMLVVMVVLLVWWLRLVRGARDTIRDAFAVPAGDDVEPAILP